MSNPQLNVNDAKGKLLIFKYSHKLMSWANFYWLDALLEILKQIDQDPKLRQIKESCSNDMLKYIQTFMPQAMEIQFRIIAKYGFSPDSNGLLMFTNRVREITIEDEVVANIFENFRNLLIPPLNLRTQCV